MKNLSQCIFRKGILASVKVKTPYRLFQLSSIGQKRKIHIGLQTRFFTIHRPTLNLRSVFSLIYVEKFVCITLDMSSTFFSCLLFDDVHLQKIPVTTVTFRTVILFFDPEESARIDLVLFFS